MKRILTGDRPTGKLHLGHYVGSLQNRVKLQNEYDTFIILADIQALTTHFENPELIRDSIYDVAMDNLSVGLDPEKVTIFQQSQITSIAELTIFYSMFVSVNSLRHNPTVKTEAAQYGYDDLSYGFLGYPVSQTADITFCNADLVPIGEDQIPHMEQTRKIVRRFHELYSSDEQIINIPQTLLSETPRLQGLDGNSKMGKSLGNAIYLSDSPDVVTSKVKSAVTDPARISVKDKGHPEVCMVYRYHTVFAPDEAENVGSMCRNAGIGCVACKKLLAQRLNDLLDPFREKRHYYEEHPEEVRELIMEGSRRANVIGNENLARIKEKLKISL